MFCCHAGLHAQGDVVVDQMRTLRIPRTDSPPRLADYVEGVPPDAGFAVSDFRQYRPGDGTPVSQPTTAYLSYDAENLYVVFVCKDDRNLIRARLNKRDQLLQDDRTMINLDTFHDHRHMYWFNVNPYGVQMDGVMAEGGGGGSNWDTLWYSDAQFTDDGYVAITIIPFKSIRFPNAREQTWGLLLGRFITRDNEWSIWPYVTRRLPSVQQQSGDLEGLENISPGRNIQLIPYALFSRSRYLDEPDNAAPRFLTENETRAGLDAKVILKDALTLDVALNPDFSQVESDSPQVTLNQRYEVFFPEKRPFFLDNASYFGTPEQAFFSRRIIDPSIGIRLTGKLGDWNIGALFADDRAPGESVALSDPLRDKNAKAAVFRLQRELHGRLENSSVGALFTSRDFGPASNRVYSVDASLRLLPNWTLSGQAMTGDTVFEDGRKLSGPAYFLEWSHSGNHLVSTTSYTDHSPDFRALLGFIRRLDIREASHNVGYLWRPEASAVQSFGPNITGIINYDRQGRLRDWSVRPEFEVSMTRSTRLAAWHESIYELFGGAGFRHQSSGAGFTSQWFKWLAYTATYSVGTGINYQPGSGLDPFVGSTRSARFSFTLRPGAHLLAEQIYIYSGLKTSSESGLEDVEDGTTIFDNHIVRTNVNYQFTRRLSARVIADYSSILPNSSLIAREKEKHVGFDALVTYLINPGTALHVGYTDLYDNLRLDPLESPALVRTEYPDLNTGRQIFVKLGYLLRF